MVRDTRLVGALQVLFVGEGLAIVDGLNNDAPIGTVLAFVSGASGYVICDCQLCLLLRTPAAAIAKLPAMRARVASQESSMHRAGC